ncbi:MAG: DUF4268 domain-containing protein [Verrucomicrobiota bacterium]
MDARPKRVSEILHTGDQYIIPLFQRHYSWGKDHWERLKNDVWALLGNGGKDQHFLGPLVCTATNHVPGRIPAYQLIDGQQRLTTITIMLAALRDVARNRKLDDLAAEVSEDYLVHKRKEESEHYKLLPRIGDREALIAIIEGSTLDEYKEFGVFHAWKYFYRHIEHHARVDSENSLKQLFEAISMRLSLVMITIDGENPYEIFESLNSTGLPLEEADLIRNFIFMQIPLDQQNTFDKEHWQSFEKMFAKTEDHDAISATAFYRNYLMREGEYSKATATFIDFKKQYTERDLDPESQVAELRKFAAYEVLLRRPKTCTKPALADVLRQVGLSEITTAYCLILKLMQLNEDGVLSDDDLVGCLRDLVSFAGRRAICGETTRTYNVWFVAAIGKIKNEVRRDLQSYLFGRGWPTDSIFADRLKTFPLYKRESLRSRLILEQLELSAGHKEKIDFSTLTIEHVMPQTIKKDANGRPWMEMLGDEWGIVHESYLHTLGNLSLTGYNVELSNSSYEIKKAELLKSNVQLNKYFSKIDAWNKQAIEDRCEVLSKTLTDIWSRPDVGEGYVPSAEADGYTELRPHLVKKLLYWNRLLDLLRDEKTGLEPYEVTTQTSLNFPVIDGEDFVRLMAWQNRKHRQLVVAIQFRRSKGRRCEKYLEAIKDRIEAEIGYALEWRPSEYHELRVSDHEINFSDENDWHIQHDWLTDKLEDFQRVIFPCIVEFLSKEPEPKANDEELTATKQLQLEFWQSFREYVLGSDSRMNPQKPSACHWMNFSMGTSKALPSALLNTEAGLISICLQINNVEDRLAIFNLLKQDQEAIEAEVGATLVWEEKPGNKTSHIIARKPNCDPKDKSNWPEQHKWMLKQLEKFRTTFGQRIKLMDTGEWQPEEK